MSGTADDPKPQAVQTHRLERGQRATVVARLTNGMLRLRTADGKELAGHAALDLRMALTRLLPGDAVEIEVSPFDPTKARILALARQQQDGRQQPSRSSASSASDNPGSDSASVQQPKPTTPQ